MSAAATVAEIGSRMAQFADAAHLASWAGLCPDNQESAGNIWLKRILCRWRGRGRTPATPTSRQRGKKRAILAVAHSLLVTIHAMLKNRQNFQDLGSDYFDQKNADGLKRFCLRKLAALGHKVTLEAAA